MKCRMKNFQLQVITDAYQGKNGAIYLNWGVEPILLSEAQSRNIARDIPGFNQEDYNKFYEI